MSPTYRFTCKLGAFTIALKPEHAPQTCAYFEGQFARPAFAHASIFRIVTAGNTSMRHDAPIEVVQMGLNMGEEAGHDVIAHENTQVTGLRHLRGTVSAARYVKGSAYPSFFVCMRDEPVLDFGGARHEDGEGFAAFGEVIEGMSVIEDVFGQAEATDFLEKPVALGCERLAGTA